MSADRIDDSSDAIILLRRLEDELVEKFAFRELRHGSIATFYDNVDSDAIVIVSASRAHLVRKTFDEIKNRLMQRWSGVHIEESERGES